MRYGLQFGVSDIRNVIVWVECIKAVALDLKKVSEHFAWRLLAKRESRICIIRRHLSAQKNHGFADHIIFS